MLTGFLRGDLAIDLWDYAPTPERAEAAGHQITRLLDGQSIATTGGMAEAVRIVKTSSGFMETDNASVHRWMSRWTLRYVRQESLEVIDCGTSTDGPERGYIQEARCRPWSGLPRLRSSH